MFLENYLNILTNYYDYILMYTKLQTLLNKSVFKYYLGYHVVIIVFFFF